MINDLNTPPFVLLDDSRPASKAGNSYLFSNPEFIIEANAPSEIPGALAAIDKAVEQGLYVAGWISYEVGYFFEDKLKEFLSRKPDEPLIWMMVTKKRHSLSSADTEKLFHASERGNKRQVTTQYSTSGISEQDYHKAIDAIHHYIKAGDVYQINHTFPLPIEVTGNILALYKQLRQNQPVPYSAYINTGKTEVLSFSPELFLKRSGDTLVSKPMKGTAARGMDIEGDHFVEKFLKEDIKSQAENLMIVDLIRNDLSRIAQTGSVAVPALFEVEKYRTLFQMTSTVTASATKALKPSQALNAMFPCGSVTGAPKVRAMEIIAELEHSPRGIYCGTIGYFHKNNWSLNVPIRTLILNQHQNGRLNIGSGIVADSAAKNEYAECLLKAQFCSAKPQKFALIESILVENQTCQRLEPHLDRLVKSAQYFDFSFNRADLEEQLVNHATYLEGSHKLRVLLQETGAYTFTSSELPARASGINKISISNQQTNSRDIFLRHKTTNRNLYKTEFQKAQNAGFVDVIFMNENRLVTEGAISNIFAEINGTLYTPPVSDGVLPGIIRSERLNEGTASIRSLTLDDLRAADNLYISNAVKGFIQVHMDV